MTTTPAACARTRFPQPQRLSRIIGLLCASGMLAPAYAQQGSGETITTVQVTGTMIRGAAPVGAPWRRGRHDPEPGGRDRRHDLAWRPGHGRGRGAATR